jgi:hypothetical protein
VRTGIGSLRGRPPVGEVLSNDVPYTPLIGLIWYFFVRPRRRFGKLLNAIKFCHPVKRYNVMLPPSATVIAAIRCNGMLPPSAITKGCAKYHPRRRRAAAKQRFDQDVVGVRRWRVRCGLPTIRPELVRNWLSKNRPWKRGLPCTHQRPLVLAAIELHPDKISK